MGQTERGETPLEREAIVSSATANSIEKPARRGRRWLQFGLRNLLAFMLVTGVAGGLLARWIGLANQQRVIVNQLRAARLRVTYDIDARRDVDLDDVESLSVELSRSYDGPYFWQRVDLWHKVVRVDKAYRGEVDPQAFELIAKLPDLEEISLFDVTSTSDTNGFPVLASRNRLKRLDISHRPLRPGEAARIRECNSLTWLMVRVDETSGHDLAKLDGLEQLQWLAVQGSIGDEDIEGLRHLPALETANLVGAHRVSGRGLSSFLRGSPRLKSLTLLHCDCTPEVCEALGECRTLKELHLFGTNLNDEGLAKLRQLPELESLNITRTNVSGAAFEGEGSFPSLRSLRAGNSEIDDRGVFHLTKLPRLEELVIPSTRITDAACEYLSPTRLKELDLGGTVVSDVGIGNLHCQSLEFLYLAGSNVTSRAFVSNTRCPKLRWLTLDEENCNEDDLERVLENPVLERLLTKAPVSAEFRKRHSMRFSHVVGYVHVRREPSKSDNKVAEVAPSQP